LIDTFFRQYVETYQAYKNGRWCYEDGCLYKGLADLYEASREEWFLKELIRLVSERISPEGEIEGYKREEYSLDNINAGKALFLLCEASDDARYPAALATLRDQMHTHPRTKEGNFWHKKGYPWQVWLDGLYMGPPLLARYSLDHENGDSLADVRKQFENVRRIMYSGDKGLYFHGYDESRDSTWADPETGLSSCFWSRAIAWYVMALVDMAEMLDEGHPDRGFYAGLARESCEAILEWQQPSGLWMQVIDQPERAGNYEESSASAMFAYVFLKGTRLGVLERRFADAGRKAFDGIVTRYLTSGVNGRKMGGICLMAGLGDLNGTFNYRDGKFDYYISEPIVENDPKGVGPLMMAQSEMLRLK